MHRFVCNVWIFFVSRALIIFGTVRLPVTQAHPTEIMLTTEALHVVAAAIFFDAYVTFGAILGVCTYVIGRFTIVRAFRQPLFDHFAIGRRMIVHAAQKAKNRFTCITCRFFRAQFFTTDDYLAVRAGAKS